MEPFFNLLQKKVMNRRSQTTREELRTADRDVDRRHLPSTSQSGLAGTADANRIRDHHERTGRTPWLTNLSPIRASDPNTIPIRSAGSISPMQRLTCEQLSTFALASLENARRLYDDAALLYQAGRIPGAFMTLGLAADELGKHVIVVAMPAREDTEAEWGKFWKRINSHIEKVGTATFHNWLHDFENLDSPPPKAKDFHLKRLDATYVDLRDGILRTPTEMISSQELAAVFAMVTEELQAAEQVFGSVTIATLTIHMQNVRDTRHEIPADPKERMLLLAQGLALRNDLLANNNEGSSTGVSEAPRP